MYTVTGATILPLLKFKAPRKLNIISPILAVNNALVEAVAGAMPNLDMLSLGYPLRQPLATCAALRVLNEKCPLLTYLLLWVDLSGDANILQEAKINPNLVHWNVLCSPPIRDAASPPSRSAFVMTLKRMWPGLKRLDWNVNLAAMNAAGAQRPEAARASFWRTVLDMDKVHDRNGPSQTP